MQMEKEQRNSEQNAKKQKSLRGVYDFWFQITYIFLND